MATFNPRSSANFRARGDAFNRPFAEGMAGAGAGAGAEATGAGTGAGAGAGAGTGAGAASTGAASADGAFAASSKTAEISSPFSPRMHSRLSTGAVAPCSTPMCKRTPSKKDSNSMVALSVSISARISPLSTSSPTCFNHVATTPSVMVSLSLGIRTISAMGLRMCCSIRCCNQSRTKG